MSDFLKKFKGMFVVQDESTPAPAQPTAPSKNEVTAPHTTGPATVPPRPEYSSSSARPNERFQEILLSALEKNNQEGFDYFEYRESMRNLEKMPLDEKTRYQSAFAMAQTMGATPEKLQASAQHYIGVLQGELQKFEEAHAQQRARLIGDREAEAKNLDAVIQNKAEQIKQLTKDIEEAQTRRANIAGEIEQATTKIEATKIDFETTFFVVVNQIKADMSKMNTYLK